jgi:hypothetical protein
MNHNEPRINRRGLLISLCARFMHCARTHKNEIVVIRENAFYLIFQVLTAASMMMSRMLRRVVSYDDESP